MRLAIVGCGAVSAEYHLPAVAASDAVELVAVVDPVQERAETLAAQYGATVIETDHARLVGKVEAAIVAVPNRLHAPVAGNLAAAGIHVLVEKPLARTTAECDRIAAAAAQAGVVVAVGHDFRHFPVARLAHTLLAEGLLGEVLEVDLRQSTGGNWPYASAYVFSREESGGGVLIDFGVHLLDLLGWWLGPLTVRGYRDDAAGGVETECELMLETSGGAPVSFQLTRLRPMRDTVVVRCGRGSLEIGIFEPEVLRLTLPGGEIMAGGAEDQEFSAAPMRTVFQRQLRDFAAAVRQGTSPLVPLEEGRRAVELVERAYAVREPLRRPWDWPEILAGAGEAR
ncbi:MAG: Gfo/Idh/MocA family protein [Gaiellaceae bacterium]